jgi:hypothetical protein
MKSGDSARISPLFAKGCILQTISRNRAGEVEVRTDKIEDFLKFIGTPKTDVPDERISFGSVKIDGALASVWTPYKFYLGEKFSHCGANSFQLVRFSDGQWKVQFLIDTRRKVGCD